MADQASDSIVIGADAASVMQVIADFETYPQWVDMVKQAKIVSRDAEGRATEVQFVLDAGIIKDEYILEYDWSQPNTVSWHLVQSKTMKTQDGVYRLAESGGTTTVTYDLALDLKMPMLGAFKRKGQKVIIDTALKGLKKRVESGA